MRHRTLIIVAAVLILAAVSFVTLRRSSDVAPSAPTTSGPPAGGALVGSTRYEPQSFNRYRDTSAFAEYFVMLTQAKLVRVNRLTDQLEPWLAESWSSSGDSLTWTLRLRPGLTFSDGAPFTSADVVFAFDTVYDARLDSPLADPLKVDGKPLVVTAPDAATVIVKFPGPYGPGLRILDNLPILPRHKLESGVKKGDLKSVWTPATSPTDIVGLGPFVLSEYRSGERLVFTRNPRYWRRDERGVQLPYLDRLTLEIVPDQNAELLRLQSGQIDFMSQEVRPEDYLPLKREADAGRLTLQDLGIGLDADALCFSLNPALKAADPRRAWLLSEELRHGISLAVDRRAFADTVFLGAAQPVHGPITPGNKTWFVADLPGGRYDPAAATAMFAKIGLQDHNGDGTLEDARGGAARFTLLTVRGNTSRERAAAVLRADLAKVGLAVDVAALEFAAFLQRFLKGDYDAVYFGPQATDTDPAVNLDFWLSSGPSHMWFLNQPKPATDWERQIDELIERQARTSDPAERRRLFTEVQRIFVEREPLVYFAAPRIFVATSRRIANATPAVMRPQLLWNPEALAARAAASTRRGGGPTPQRGPAGPRAHH